jgi:hypothetical protein
MRTSGQGDLSVPLLGKHEVAEALKEMKISFQEKAAQARGGH